MLKNEIIIELSGILVGGRHRYANALAGPLPLYKRKEEMGGRKGEDKIAGTVISTKTLEFGVASNRHNNCKT